jgi:hypothetical protein
MSRRAAVIAGVITGLISLAATSLQASESCMSKAEARAHFGAAPLYWHGAQHCWDATSNRRRKVGHATRSINLPIRQPADQQIERESRHPLQSEPAPQVQPQTEPSNLRSVVSEARDVAAEASTDEPVQRLRSGDHRPSVADPAVVPRSSDQAWIFIATACVAALWLILQSADGFAPARLPMFVNKRGLFLSEIGRRFGRWIQQRRMSDGSAGPAACQAAPKEPTRPSALAATNSMPALAPPSNRRRRDGRTIIRISELEAAIGNAVKNSAPGCEAFVGVVVQRKQPESPLAANWELCGKKFGQADRVAANEALASVVKRMEKEFCVAEG